MENKINISVIIPAYNAGAYMEDCLESVMTQEGAFFEVIVVNDGSTDGTAKICKKWMDKCRNLVYIEQEKKGQGTARNAAIQHAKGEWLVFLDADDTMLPGALGYLKRNAPEETDILVYGCIFISRDQRWSLRQLPPDTDDKEKIMKETVSVLWDKMIRKEFWKKEEIQLLNTYGEDVCPAYILEARAKRIRTLQVPLMCHYDRADNLSSKPEQIMQIVKTLQDTLRTFEERGLFESYSIPLFCMLLNHHKHYFRLWRGNHRNTEKKITEELKKIAVQYFPEEYQKLFEAEKESLIVIGKVDRPFPAELEARDVYYYPHMEQYLLDEGKVTDTACHFIINVENEIRSVITCTRTKEWALSYWSMQCIELSEIRKSKRLKGSVFLYCPKLTGNNLVSCFEEAAQKIWNCGRLERLEDIWRYADAADGSGLAEQAALADTFHYRVEYMRLDMNVSLLCTWLRLKQQGTGLERYFVEHRYRKIGIYGMGYLGELLADELECSAVKVLYFVDRKREKEAFCSVYSPDAVLPEADVIVVSVLHSYDAIRVRLKCACPVISLEEVTDWCAKEAIEEGNQEYVS